MPKWLKDGGVAVLPGNKIMGRSVGRYILTIEADHTKLASIPRHIGMVPGHVGELGAIGRKTWIAVEIISTCQYLDISLHRCAVGIHRDDFVHHILRSRIGMVLSDHDKTRLISIVVTVREAIATSLAVWCDWCRIAPVGREFHDPLGAKVRVESIAITAKSYSRSTVLMHSRPYVALLGCYVDSHSLRLVGGVGVVAAENISATLLRPALQPQKVASSIKVKTADANTSGSDGLRRYRRLPRSVGQVKRRRRSCSRG
mmetsp:Transcript_32111/g.94505  ORF Transcript_32111/g.94505 Transcript_32111/m.94505 type:complete len:258 (-) Transcript_32111:10-783(-)